MNQLTRKSCIRGAFSTLALTLLAACAPGPNAVLPDDPTSEVVREDDSEILMHSMKIARLSFREPQYSTRERQQILDSYSYVDPTQMIPDRLLESALLYYHENLTSIRNQSVLSVIDFSQHSSRRRFFIINMSTGVVTALHVAHGSGSDRNNDGYAESFSNVSGSHQSSLGYYLTAETYYGNNGLSLRLDGLSSTNSKARSRAIVVHGSNYVRDANVQQGRSWGCPAVTHAYRDRLIAAIKQGSLIYADR